MIRWLSQLWISSAVDADGEPSRLWRWTFGRLASHRRFASQLRQLDGQLKRQASSQQRAIARQAWPIGHYPAQSKPAAGVPADAHAEHASGWRPGLWRPVLAAGLCAVLIAVGWVAWPTGPTQSPDVVPAAFSSTFARVWDPLSQQAQSTGQALREQTTTVTRLPERLPAIDQMVNDLGLAIETPLREEMRRFADDVARPWTYLASQLPLPARGTTPEQVKG